MSLRSALAIPGAALRSVAVRRPKERTRTPLSRVAAGPLLCRAETLFKLLLEEVLEGVVDLIGVRPRDRVRAALDRE